LQERLRAAVHGKIVEVTNYLLEQTDKVVVFAYHQELIEMEYAVRLRRAGHKVITPTGANTKETAVLVDKFQTDPSIQYFILSIGVGGVGRTLTKANHVVFAELPWSAGDLEQCLCRVHRQTQERPVIVDYCLLRNSFDHVIWDRLLKKIKPARQALNRQSKES
jgi:SNF2 family DNA or RNA helicase